MERMRSCLAGSVLISQKGSSMSFAHDGLHDQLTRLAAPPHYYEILRREIALANRNLTELTAIRIILTSSAPLYAATIISFADLITNSFRYEDAKARLGENEFALLIRGDQVLATDLSTMAGNIFGLGPKDPGVPIDCYKALGDSQGALADWASGPSSLRRVELSEVTIRDIKCDGFGIQLSTSATARLPIFIPLFKIEKILVTAQVSTTNIRKAGFSPFGIRLF